MARATSNHTREKFSKIIGQRVRKIREEKGITSRTFEAMDGSLDRHALSKIENGKTTPSIFTLYKICKVLEIELEDFFNGMT